MKFAIGFGIALWLLLFIPGVIGLFAATEVELGYRIAYVVATLGILVPPLIAWLATRHT